MLKDWAERERRRAAIQQDIQGRLERGRRRARPSSSRRRRCRAPAAACRSQYVIQSIGDRPQVFEVAEEIKNKAQASGRFIVVQNSIAFDAAGHRSPSTATGRPRSACRSARSAPRSALLVGGAPISKFDRDSQQLRRDHPGPRRVTASTRSARPSTSCAPPTAPMVPLSAVVSIKTDASPAAIEQFNQLNSATISALPLPGVTTGDGLADPARDRRRSCPRASSIDYSGQSRLEIQEGNSILIAFGLAVIVIYLVLAAQFESFRDPFIIMMSVPLSMFGAMIFR